MSAIDRLGHIGFFSLGLMLSSLLLAATALWSIWKLKLLYSQLTAKKSLLHRQSICRIAVNGSRVSCCSWSHRYSKLELNLSFEQSSASN
jgi:hypothetical protein